MVRLISLAAVLALVPALAVAQVTTPPPLNTNTGSGARTSTTTTIKLTSSGTVTTTSGIAGFTGAGGYVSRYPVRVTSNGVVYISTATITLIPATNRPSVTGLPVNTANSSSGSGTNRGAIAGGVIGACAVIIAVVATILWFRRRSPAHWKAKTRGWRNIGGAGAGSGKPPLLPTANESQHNFANEEPKFPEFKRPTPAHSVTDLQKDNPFNDPVEAPPPALYIREHRLPAHDPFADPPASPSSPTGATRPNHHRATSSVNPLLTPRD